MLHYNNALEDILAIEICQRKPFCLLQDKSVCGRSVSRNKHAALRPFPWGRQIIRTVVPDGGTRKPFLYTLVVPDNLSCPVYR